MCRLRAFSSHQKTVNPVQCHHVADDTAPAFIYSTRLPLRRIFFLIGCYRRMLPPSYTLCSENSFFVSPSTRQKRRFRSRCIYQPSYIIDLKHIAPGSMTPDEKRRYTTQPTVTRCRVSWKISLRTFHLVEAMIISCVVLFSAASRFLETCMTAA